MEISKTKEFFLFYSVDTLIIFASNAKRKPVFRSNYLTFSIIFFNIISYLIIIVSKYQTFAKSC